MNSKAKGQLSEARALYEFQKYHIPVCLPWGDNERYDMIAEFDGKFNRIQVKTSNEEENGAVCVAGLEVQQIILLINIYLHTREKLIISFCKSNS